MGLDAVEIVLRTEELFTITIEDAEAAAARTVGDFYILVCSKLNVAPISSPVTSAQLPVITRRETVFLFLNKNVPLPAPSNVLPWSPQSVWDCLVAILVDQQCLSREQIRYQARFLEDLSVD